MLPLILTIIYGLIALKGKWEHFLRAIRTGWAKVNMTSYPGTHTLSHPPLHPYRLCKLQCLTEELVYRLKAIGPELKEINICTFLSLCKTF